MGSLPLIMAKNPVLYPQGMVIPTQPLGRQLPDPEEGMSLQVREVMMNIEHLRVVQWSKILSIEGMLELADVPIPARPDLPANFGTLDPSSAFKPGGALYEQILACGEEQSQLGFAQNYFQHTTNVIEHAALLSQTWRECCAEISA